MDLCVAAKLVLWRIPPSRNYVGSPLLQESIVLPHHQGVECLPVYVASLEMSIGFFTGTGFPLGPRRNPVKFTSLEGREAIRTIGKVCLLQAELEWRGKGHNACQVSKMGTYGICILYQHACVYTHTRTLAHTHMHALWSFSLPTGFPAPSHSPSPRPGHLLFIPLERSKGKLFPFLWVLHTNI